MSILLNAVLPIFILILMGFFLKKSVLPKVQFWQTLDGLTYYLFMPSLLLYKIATGDFSHSGIDALKSVAIIIFSMIIITLLAIILFRAVRIQAARFTSFYQGAIRYNTYILLAIVDQIYGTAGMVIAAFLIALVVPVINILCVSIFAFYIQDGHFSVAKIIKTILSNPLIIACALGGVFNLLHLNSILLQPFSLLGNAAITLGLLSIGAGLKLKSIPYNNMIFWLSSIFKLLLFPALVWGLALAFRLPELYLAVCVVFAAMPTATSGYILAGQLGGDKEWMSMIITTQTLICPLSLWLVLAILSVD